MRDVKFIISSVIFNKVHKLKMGYTKEKASKQLDDKGKATVGPLLSALIGKLISEPYVVHAEGFAARYEPAS